MSVSIHIELLALEGLPMSAIDQRRFKAAVELELSRLFSSGHVSADFLAQGNIPVLRGTEIRLPAATGSRHLGRELAAGVYGAMGGQGTDQRGPEADRSDASERRP